MPDLTFVYTYYDNAAMLAEQYRIWSQYPADLARRVEVILVDDASPKFPAAEVPRPPGMPTLAIYRVALDIPWHQDGARNLGADRAADGWLFLCDIDHALPADSLRVLLGTIPKADGDSIFFTFPRLEAPNLSLVKKGPGANIMAMTRKTYWTKMLGYDEDMCGQYGTDGAPRKRLLRHAANVVLKGCPVVRYGRSYIVDASTSAWERRGPDNERRKREVVDRKKRLGRAGRITHLDFEWSRAL